MACRLGGGRSILLSYGTKCSIYKGFRVSNIDF